MAYQAVETTWLENIVDLTVQETPQGRILLIGLANGHRYAIPLTNEAIRQAVSKAASPLTIVQDIPGTNGQGT